MKKYFTLFLLVAVIALSAVGCSSKDEAQNSSFQDETNKPVEIETVENNDNSTAAQNEEEIQINFQDNFSFELISGVGGNTTFIKYWKQNGSYRMEVLDSVTKKTIVMINSEKNNAFYQYLPDENMATKTIRQDGMDNMWLCTIEELTLDRKSLKELKVNGDFEELTYNGQDVYYFEKKVPGVNSVTRMWISKEYGLIIKMEQEVEENIVMSQEIKNLKKGPFDESLFTIPEGVTVQEL
ncbi:hypothetical protein FQB35_04130 [Crassaminicella thermophila]|uniref:Outer membrane lipoprotein-sorting protein n=1 Tax=Crassaminicella thermophila TaxID=2599308 RepID=A0A5C0SAL0_CRATE|nr:hypothetical protein [Crassaminicella thermophila]QEK11613.1 hypothetical protein FQB35_04130 [Crassaminicella thermophila]